MGIIKNKLEQNLYHSGQDCINDFRLVFSNCYTYNKPTDVRIDTTVSSPFVCACLLIIPCQHIPLVTIITTAGYHHDVSNCGENF